MRSLLLLIALIFCATLQAQESTANLPRLQERALSFKMSGKDLQQAKPQLVIAQKGNQVISLSQDNMPCMVPDTTGIAAMPNVGAGLQLPLAGRIPNAVKPEVEK